MVSNPLGLARRLYRRIFPAPLPAKRLGRWRRPDRAPADVTVVGYLRTASGVGEAGRQTVRSLAASGLKTEACDTGLNVASSREEKSCASHFVETSSAPVQIFNINADQLPLVLADLHPRLRPDAKRVCVPFWELSRFPEPWLAGLRRMDEIWAPSRFVAEALRSRLGKRVVHIPMALEFSAPAPMPREKFGLPKDRFLFLFAFDFLSFIDRKNPLGAIAAFRQAFPKRGEAGLVLKCSNGAAEPEKFSLLHRAIGDDPDIFLIDHTLTRADTLALLASADAVLSLHRSEGFGLLIGEAMLLGKPVIATDYSASRDLLSPATGYPVRFELIPVAAGQYPFAERQVWADPDIGHAASLMRELIRDPTEARIRIARARAHMRENFSYEHVGRLQAERLRKLR